MKYIYLNNFRGFNKTLIPLAQVNFLIGENSTGKSSFLKILEKFNQHEFWLKPTFSSENESLTFSDLVSAWSKDKSFFQVGVVTHKDQKNPKSISFEILEFQSVNELPEATSFISYTSSGLSAISKINDKRINYLIDDSTQLDFSVENIATEIDSMFSKVQSGAAQHIQKELFHLPLRIVLDIIKDLDSKNKSENATSNNSAGRRSSFLFNFPMSSMGVKLISPIRSQPKKVYEGVNLNYSADGDHAPLLLKKTLSGRSNKSKEFKSKLGSLGELSGLFEKLTTHPFGSGKQNPFEVLVKFSGSEEINIKNVGYGVSQVLPLLVEFLTSENKRIFTVQQPEVHLHPKAQAALGDLIYELASTNQHCFYIETHSDYLIDRFRLAKKSAQTKIEAQVLFFERTKKGNTVYPLKISDDGLYPENQPAEFKSFFINEQIKLLEL